MNPSDHLRRARACAAQALHLCWRFARAMRPRRARRGGRRPGRVFLVRHSYVSGWHLPGGGVEPGGTLIEALVRELREEGSIELTEPPQLFGLFFNERVSRRDHVALYVVRAFRQQTMPVPGGEIVAHGFFAPDALPKDTTAGTRARIAEVLGGAPAGERW